MIRNQKSVLFEKGGNIGFDLGMDFGLSARAGISEILRIHHQFGVFPNLFGYEVVI